MVDPLPQRHRHLRVPGSLIGEVINPTPGRARPTFPLHSAGGATQHADAMRIGVLSDTHGYLNPKIFDLFAEVNLILHAGDIGDDRVLTDLEQFAPTRAVTGNIDGSPTTRRPLRFSEDIAGVRVCMTHGHLLDGDDYNLSAYRLFEAEKPRVIIHGHTHKAKNELIAGVLFLNPGAAGKARFNDIASVCILDFQTDGEIVPRFIKL